MNNHNYNSADNNDCVLFLCFPELKQVEGFSDFIRNKGQLRSEKADLRNDVREFEKMIDENKFDCMVIHASNSCFAWTNWKRFCKEEKEEKGKRLE